MKIDRQAKTESGSEKSKATKKTRSSRAKSTHGSNGRILLPTYEHAPIGIVECSPDGKHVNANEEFCRFLGYEREELIGKSIKELTHEDDYPLDIKLHRQLVEGKIPFYRLEKRYLHKNGTSIWTELTRSVVRDAAGNPLYTLGVVLDISDRKHVERVLRESVERLRLATEAARMFTWELDLQTRIYTFADSFEKVLGFSGGLLPKNSVETVEKLSFPEDVQAFWEAVAKAIEQGGDLHSVQLRVVNPETNEIVWLEVNAKIVYDDDRNAQRMFGVAQNITENKKAQQEILIISRMPEENPHPVMRLTPAGNVLYANPPSASLLKSWERGGAHPIPDELQASVAEVFALGSKQEVEIEQDGKVFSATLAPIPEAGYVNFYGSDVTQRRRAERSLRESEERFRALVSQATAGIIQTDLQGKLTFANQKITEMLGYHRLDLIGKTIQELTYAGDWAQLQTLFEQLVETGKPFEIEQCLLRQDESTIWVSLSMSPLRDANANMYSTIAVIVDITERKRAEEQLQQQAEILEWAYVLIRDLDNCIISWNKGMERLYGWTKEEALGKVSNELFQTKFPVSREDIQEKLFTDGEWEGELEHVKRDGTRLFIHSHQVLYRDAAGKPIAILEDNSDITERKYMESALDTERELLNRIFEAIPVMLTVYEPSTNVLRLNAKFEQLIGWKNEEAAGSSLMEAVYPDPGYREEVWQFMDRSAENEWMDIQMRTRDGRALESSWSNIRLSNHMQVGIGIDITERKRTERALKEFARQQEALYQFTDELQHTNSLGDVFNAGLDAILSGLQCDRASILLYDNANVMRFVAWRGLSDEYRKATDGHSPWQPDAKDPEPICMGDVATADLSDSLRVVIQKEGIGALAFIPLAVNGKLIGKFMTYYNAPHAFGEEEVELGLTIARQLAFGIDRKRAQEALVRERELLKRLFETMPVMVSIYDAETQSLRLNEEFERVLGWRDDEVTVPFLLEGLYPDPDYRTQALQKMAAAGRNDWVEVRVQTRDGRTLDTLWANISIQKDEQLITGIALGIDITERQRAEEQVRESEERYRTIVDTANEGIWYIDLHATSMYLNEPMAQILGYSLDEVLGHQVPEFCFAEDMLKVQERIKSNYEGNYEHFDFRFRRKDGSEVLVLASTSPVRNAAGEITGAMGMFVDITERKRAEAALQTSEQRFREIFETAGVSVWLEDFMQVKTAIEDLRAQGVEDFRTYFLKHPEFVRDAITLVHILDVNNETLDLFGAKNKQDLLGSLSNVFAPETEQIFIEELLALAEGRQTLRAETQVRSLDGRSIAVLFTVHFASQTGDQSHVVVTLTDITERKRAEEALRVENERFMRFVDSNIVGILIGDASGRVVLANDYYLNLLGVNRRDFAEGKVDWKKFTPPEWLPADEKAIQELHERGVCEPYEKEYVRADGTRVPVYITNAMLPGPGEEIAAFVLDITERKRTEGELRASESLYRTIARSIPGGGVYVVDKDMRYIVADGAVTEAFDLSREMLEGHTVSEVFQGEQRARMIERLNRNFAGESVSYETEYQGRIFWTQQAPLSESIGQAIIVTIDITERKRAEEELRESEERFRAILGQATAGIVRKDAEGRLLFVNQAYCTMLGYPESELIGKPFWEFIHEDDLQENKRLYKRLMQEGVPFKLEKRLLRADGSILWADVSVSPIMDARGKPQSAVAVEVDITARKQAEEALQLLNLRLETRVIERTAELQAMNESLQDEIQERRQVELALDDSRKHLQILTKRLVEVQEEERRAIARELHDRVGQTLSALNINLIIMRGQILPDSLERVGARFDDSMQLVGETITLVRDVMSNLRPAVLDDYGLEAAIQSHVDEFAARYGIRVVFERPAQPIPRLGPSVEMTFLRIAQEALINIARHANATRATLSLWQENDSVCMSIQDNGSGIVSWQQANRPGSHGLTIMRERAEAFGGNFKFGSVPGKGTRIDMSIPVGKGSQTEAQKEILE